MNAHMETPDQCMTCVECGMMGKGVIVPGQITRTSLVTSETNVSSVSSVTSDLPEGCGAAG